MRVLAGALALLLMASWLLPAQSLTSRPVAISTIEKLAYDVEWRLIHAGTVVVEAQKSRAALTLESAGMVSTLFKIHDVYTVNYDDPFCATSSLMDSSEGKRHHETKVTYDRERNHATFLERDLLKDTVIRTNEIEVPHCVHDAIGALLQLRGMTLEPGQSFQIPMSDGRRSAFVKVEALDREEVKTPAGAFKTVRIEPLMLNNIVYSRKGRVFIWVTDDARHLPVQIRLRMQFPIGTVTLQLQKEEHL